MVQFCHIQELRLPAEYSMTKTALFIVPEVRNHIKSFTLISIEICWYILIKVLFPKSSIWTGQMISLDISLFQNSNLGLDVVLCQCTSHPSLYRQFCF